jgi:hypothetical protein
MQSVGINEYVMIYYKAIVLESNNPQYNRGDFIESVCISLHMHLDGSIKTSNDNTATYHGYYFSYEKMTVKELYLNHYVNVYSKVIILNSIDPRYKRGDRISKISVPVQLFIDDSDGDE